MTTWTKAVNGQSALKCIVLYFGYGQERYPSSTPLDRNDRSEDDTYEDFNNSCRLDPHMDFGYDNGIRMCWKRDTVGNWSGGRFDHNGINFAMFSFDNTDQSDWRYMPDDENHPRTRKLVRGSGCQFPGDEREFIFGFD